MNGILNKTICGEKLLFDTNASFLFAHIFIEIVKKYFKNII